MGAYSLDTLVQKWRRGEITVEQAIGQMLLLLKELNDTVIGLERQLYRRPPHDADAGEERR